MVVDFQTSMREIREANLASVRLLTQLKSLLAGKGPISINVDGEEMTVPTFPDLIAAYRGGQFSEVILRSGDTELHLVNENGALKVTDAQGRLVPVQASEIRFSSISGSTFESIEATECSIDSASTVDLELSGQVNVSNFSATELEANTVFAQTLQASRQIQAKQVSVSELLVMREQFSPLSLLNVFASGLGPYNYNADNAWFPEDSGHKVYSCTPSGKPLWKDPTTMGFFDLDALGATVVGCPDLTIFQGDTRLGTGTQHYDVRIYNLHCMDASGKASEGLVYTKMKRSPDGQDIADWGTPAELQDALAWPLKSFTRDPAAVGLEGRSLAYTGKGAVFLHEVSPSEVGRFIYLQTVGNPVKFYRRLSITQDESIGRPLYAVLDTYDEIPPYTCLRLRLDRLQLANGSVSVLEYA